MPHKKDIGKTIKIVSEKSGGRPSHTRLYIPRAKSYKMRHSASQVAQSKSKEHLKKPFITFVLLLQLP